MKFYDQSDLFWVLASALRDPNLTPDDCLLCRYKEKRNARAVKALRSRNLFLYTAGTRTGTDLHTINTSYTQAAGEPLIIVGYADNLRYGATSQVDPGLGTAIKVTFPQMHRIRIVGQKNNAHDALSDDLLTAQMASGQPGYT